MTFNIAMDSLDLWRVKINEKNILPEEQVCSRKNFNV
jgi:hypothetical protein